MHSPNMTSSPAICVHCDAYLSLTTCSYKRLYRRQCKRQRCPVWWTRSRACVVEIIQGHLLSAPARTALHITPDVEDMHQKTIIHLPKLCSSFPPRPFRRQPQRRLCGPEEVGEVQERNPDHLRKQVGNGFQHSKTGSMDERVQVQTSRCGLGRSDLPNTQCSVNLRSAIATTRQSSFKVYHTRLTYCLDT